MIYNIDQIEAKNVPSPATINTKGPKHPKNNLRRSILACLVVLAGCVSLINLVIGHKVHYAHYTETPPERKRPPIRLSQNQELQAPMIRAYLTSILAGQQPYPTKKIFKFAPGSLLLTSAEAFRHCYVNLTTYGNHVPDYSNLLAAVSDEYQLIYRNIPKSASSTGRHVIQDFMGGEDRRLSRDALNDLVNEEGYQLISFVREPLNRFYSSYDEAFFRIGPWMGDGEIVRDKPRVRKWYHKNKHKMDKYPYLYEGMRTLEDFRAMYCPPEVLESRNPLKCNEVPSIDDGNLARRFERFVNDYSGLDPFDVHLNLQVTNLVFGLTAEPLPVSVLYNASDAEREWREIAKERGVEIDDGDITHARKISRRFHVDMVSNETKRKICKILALDYCCLNLKLPEVCKMETEEDINGVFCRMKEVDGKVIIEDWR